MAFLKYARASVVKPAISMAEWEHDVRAKAQALGTAFEKRSSLRTILQKCNPSQYLLSHATIIASVDIETAPGPTGRHMVDGFQVDRRWTDYYITPETSKYVNSNGDSWSRQMLLASFRTFIGAENYCEHLQIPELSKGKIIDAVARDIGDSIYVDILVATERKHKPLIEAVESGELQTLSMGAQVTHTTCTKCGNVALDETQLCGHVRFMKRNSFVDSLGKRRIVAELCGHHSEPNSVRFIEASWVAHPAFTGAVLRSILTPEQVLSLGNRIQVAFEQAPRVADVGSMQRAASRVVRGQGFNFGEGGEGGGEAPAAAGEEAPKGDDPLEKAIGDMADFIREKAIGKVRQQMSEKEVPRVDLDENRNDTLVKEAARNSKWRGVAQIVRAKAGSPENARRLLFGLLLYRHGGWRSLQSSGRFKGPDILALSRLLDSFSGTPRIAGEARLYRTVVAVGGTAAYLDVESYLAACRRVMGRDLTGSEKDTLVVKGRLYDLGA